MLPVEGGSSSGTGGKLPVVSVLLASVLLASILAVSVLDWNRSPSLVEVSQLLSHSRHATVATTTRPALPPIGAFPRQPMPSVSARRGESTHATLRFGHDNNPAAPS